jgi:hypothetical protein
MSEPTLLVPQKNFESDAIGHRSNIAAIEAFANFTSNAVVPTGGVISYAGPIVPPGYLRCNGALVNRVEFAALFSVIGTTYGAGDGVTTFKLPTGAGVIGLLLIRTGVT